MIGLGRLRMAVTPGASPDLQGPTMQGLGLAGPTEVVEAPGQVLQALGRLGVIFPQAPAPGLQRLAEERLGLGGAPRVAQGDPESGVGPDHLGVLRAEMASAEAGRTPEDPGRVSIVPPPPQLRTLAHKPVG